jgi:hypothetical protein
MQRQSYCVTNAPLVAVADVDVEPAGPLPVGSSRHVESGGTVATRQDLQGALGLLGKKRGKQFCDSGEDALIMLQKLLGRFTVKAFFRSHEVGEFFLLIPLEPHLPHAFVLDARRNAFYLSQADGVNLLGSQRCASVELRQGRGSAAAQI